MDISPRGQGALLSAPPRKRIVTVGGGGVCPAGVAPVWQMPRPLPLVYGAGALLGLNYLQSVITLLAPLLLRKLQTTLLLV